MVYEDHEEHRAASDHCKSLFLPLKPRVLAALVCGTVGSLPLLSALLLIQTCLHHFGPFVTFWQPWFFKPLMGALEIFTCAATSLLKKRQYELRFSNRKLLLSFKTHNLNSNGMWLLYPYTAQMRDVLGNTSPKTERFPKGMDFAPRGPRAISRAEAC